MVRKRPEGSQVADGGNGLCGSCYTRIRRAETAAPEPEFAALAEAPDWRLRAVCKRDDNPDRWFSVSDAQVADLRAICFKCPVRIACAEFAVKHYIAHGIWGGCQLDNKTERDSLRGMYRPAEVEAEEEPERYNLICSCGAAYTAAIRRTRCQACRLGYVSSGPAQDHYVALRKAKVPLRRIVEDTGISKTVLITLARPTTTHVAASTAQRLLAFPLPEAVTV